MIGIKADEKRTIQLTFPENYVEKLKGKPATFDVTCSDVKEKVVPELNEEFIQELGLEGVKDEATLKEHCKKEIAARKEKENRDAQLEEIINKAIDNATVVLPDAVVQEEADAMLDQVREQLKNSGLSYEDYLSINGKDEKALEEDRKKEAVKNLKSALVVNQIMNAEGLGVTEEVLNQQYQNIADQYKMNVDEVRKTLEPNKNQLINQLKNKIFAEFMMANN